MDLGLIWTENPAITVQLKIPEADSLKVIIAVDGSEQSEKAFQYYFDHCYEKDHDVNVAFGMEMPVVIGANAETSAIYEEMLSEKHDEAERVRDRFGELLKEKGVAGRFVSAAHAQPCEWLVEVAKGEEAGLVVVGSKGRKNVWRTVMGSVSSYLLNHLNCPVMVYCEKSKKP